MNNSTPTKPNAPMAVKHGLVTVPIYQSRSGKTPRYQVRYYPPGGRRQVRSFRDLDRARWFAKAVAAGEAESLGFLLRMTPASIRTAAQIAIKLQSFVGAPGLPLDQAIHEYCEAKELLQGQDLIQLLRETLAQPWREREHTPFLTAMESFLADKAASGRSMSTCHRLKNILKAVGSALGNPPLREVAAAQLNQLVHQSNRSPATNRSYLSTLVTFYQWLEENDYLRPARSFARAVVQSGLTNKPAPAAAPVTCNRKPKPALEEDDETGADE